MILLPSPRSSPQPSSQSSSQRWQVPNNSIPLCYILLFGCCWVNVLLIHYFHITVALFAIAGIFVALLSYPLVWLSRYIPRGLSHYLSQWFSKPHRRSRTRLLRRFIASRVTLCSIAALIMLMSIGIATPTALAQLPSLTAPNTTPPLPTGVEWRGTLETAGVHLDGKELFKIASPAVFNRNDPGSQIPVEVRAKQVESNLKQVVDGGLAEGRSSEPKTMQVSIETLNGHPVLFAKDATLAEARVLVTVTDADTQYHAISQDQLAERWQKILEGELRQALELRQPEALRQQISSVIRIGSVAALLTLLLGGLWTHWGRRRKQLEQRQATEMSIAQAEVGSGIGTRDAGRTSAEGTGTKTNYTEPPLQLFHRLHHYLGLQQRLQIVRFLQWLTFWVIAFVWVIAIAYSLSAFPQTRQYANRVVTMPIVLLIAWFLTGLINRLMNLGIDRFIASREQDQSLTPANCQRIATIANVIKGLKLVLVYAVSILWVLQWLNIASGSVLALGALVALAVSFAAQSLVKDLVNGFLILLEDHFRIGDQIKTETASGLVENLNLRITQIRNDDGNLITLPNSLITQVENMSRTWARADVRIEVAYNTDVDYALAVVRETADRMAQDPEWQSVILNTHELFGVDQISHTGIVIRIWIKTAPLKQWAVARELRRRLKIAFDHKNVQIGIPQQLLLSNVSGSTNNIRHLKEIE